MLISFSKDGHSQRNCVHSVIDGWLICDFTSLSKVYQSYQDDERLVIKAVGTPFTVQRTSPLAGLELWHVSALPTELPGLMSVTER